MKHWQWFEFGLSMSARQIVFIHTGKALNLTEFREIAAG
jgi:hypothetical protein